MSSVRIAGDPTRTIVRRLSDSIPALTDEPIGQLIGHTIQCECEVRAPDIALAVVAC
jgi:hypothetical protein